MTRTTEEDLRSRLADAEEVLRAIRDGEVDAVVVAGRRGEKIYTLSGADRVYRQLIETMSEGAMTLSDGGVILYANPRLAKMLGRPLDQILGTLFRGHLPSEDQTALDAALAQAGSEPLHREIRLKTGDGRLVPVYLSASRWEGEGTGYCLVLTDLTELRLRTAQVEAANKDLEAANSDLEAFTSSVSHDLRAPLRSVDGYSRMLLESYAPKMEPEGVRLLGLVRKRVETMSRLIDDLLAFSKLGRQPMAKSLVSMEAVVGEAIEALDDQREGRRVRFNVGTLATCEGDPSLLKQVWINLLANALKFTRLIPEALIEVDSHEAMGETIYRVKDNGAGFDMRDADLLFKIFQRLHPKDEFEGTGVGLAIVARIVQRHGGRVWARSEPGKGAEFLFNLGKSRPAAG